MTGPIHPARAMPFAGLLADLDRARALGFLHRQVNYAAGLQLFIYKPLVGKSREALLRSVRPTGNVLPGYAPSYAMGRVLDEAAS